VIQDNDRQVRCARLTGDNITAATDSGDIWRQLADVHHLEVEDASDELVASVTRHAAQLACVEVLSVAWTPMKVVPGPWMRSLLPRLTSLSLTRNQLRSVWSGLFTDSVEQTTQQSDNTRPYYNYTNR